MDIFIVMLTAFILYIAEGEIYERLWKKGLTIKSEIYPPKAEIGEKCRLTVSLANKKSLPLPWLWVKMHISSALVFENEEKTTQNEYVYKNALFCIMGWQQIDRSLSFTCTKRGYYPLSSLELIGTSILFNGKYRFSQNDGLSSVTVYPRLVSVKDFLPVVNILEGMVSSQGFINPDPFEFSGIREYTSTDSFKNINFKASARIGRLMTNTYSPTTKGQVTIVLCFKPLSQSFLEERWEYSISLAASLANYYIEKGYSLSFYSNGCVKPAGTAIVFEGIVGKGALSPVMSCLAGLDYYSREPVEGLVRRGEGSCIFISPTVDFEVIEVFNSLKKGYMGIKWLYPVMDFDAVRTTAPCDEGVIVPVSREVI